MTPDKPRIRIGIGMFYHPPLIKRLWWLVFDNTHVALPKRLWLLARDLYYWWTLDYWLLKALNYEHKGDGWWGPQ